MRGTQISCILIVITNLKKMPSPANSFRGTGKKLLKSLYLSLLGGLSAWAATELPSYDFGMWSGLIGASVPFIINAATEYVKKS